jgi:hypothetical protein
MVRQQIALEVPKKGAKWEVFLSLNWEDLWIVAYRPRESRCGSNAGSVHFHHSANAKGEPNARH